MKYWTRGILCFITVAALQIMASAEEEKAEQKTTISGFGYFMFGQIVHGIVGNGIPDPIYQSGDRLNHYWQENADVDLYLTSKQTDWLTVKAGLSVITSLPLQYGSMDIASFFTYYSFSVPMAEGIFQQKFNNVKQSSVIGGLIGTGAAGIIGGVMGQRFGNVGGGALIGALIGSTYGAAIGHYTNTLNTQSDNISLTTEAGFFPYTFNPEVKNLGNYIYRSTVFPLSIQTKLDYPWENMMGVRSEAGFLNDKIKIGVIFNSIIDFMPWYDWSLGFTGSYTPNKVIDIGAAVCFDRIINVGHSSYLPDTTTNKMKALKVAARFTFDPKPLLKPLCGDLFLFDEKSIIGFGPEDLKIYGEAAVLGQNDSALFNFIPKPIYWLGMPVRRMPLLLGMNFPGCKILDVISIELEWFKSPYPNDWLGDLPYGKLLPRDFSGREADDYINKDNFKWSVYLKKKILSNFEIRGIAANDHYIYKAYNLGNKPCTEQTLKRKGDWHWYFELRFNY
jgi:hypothetical protein